MDPVKCNSKRATPLTAHMAHIYTIQWNNCAMPGSNFENKTLHDMITCEKVIDAINIHVIKSRQLQQQHLALFDLRMFAQLLRINAILILVRLDCSYFVRNVFTQQRSQSKPNRPKDPRETRTHSGSNMIKNWAKCKLLNILCTRGVFDSSFLAVHRMQNKHRKQRNS